MKKTLIALVALVLMVCGCASQKDVSLHQSYSTAAKEIAIADKDRVASIKDAYVAAVSAINSSSMSSDAKAISLFGANRDYAEAMRNQSAASIAALQAPTLGTDTQAKVGGGIFHDLVNLFVWWKGGGTNKNSNNGNETTGGNKTGINADNGSTVNFNNYENKPTIKGDGNSSDFTLSAPVEAPAEETVTVEPVQ